MKIYFDNCALQRPLDNKNQIRIILEAEAVLALIDLYESGKIELVSSDVLLFEIQNNPNSIRKEFAINLLKNVKENIALNENIEKKADLFNKMGVKPLDSLHLASAEFARVEYFCTCDDKLLKKVKNLEDIKLKVVTPLELIEELEK